MPRARSPRPEDVTGLRGLTDGRSRFPTGCATAPSGSDAGDPARHGRALRPGRRRRRDQRPRRGALLPARVRARTPHPHPRPARAARRPRRPERVHPEGRGRRPRAGRLRRLADARHAVRRSRGPRASCSTTSGSRSKRFERYFDRGFNKRHGLRRGIFFDKETYGRDQLAFGSRREILADAPLSRARRRRPDRGCTPTRPTPSGLSRPETKAELTKLTYRAVPRAVRRPRRAGAGLPAALSDDHWGYGIDAVGAIDAWADGYPGFDGLGPRLLAARPRQRPHRAQGLGLRGPLHPPLPRGQRGRRALDHPQADPRGATRRRGWRRSRRPSSTTGSSTRRATRADPAAEPGRPGAPPWRPTTRDEVEVAYVQDGELRTRRGEQVVLACWNAMIPYICEELPARAARGARVRDEALAHVRERPDPRTGRSFAKLGLAGADCPQHVLARRRARLPGQHGRVRFPERPDEPMVLHLPRR